MPATWPVAQRRKEDAPEETLIPSPGISPSGVSVGRFASAKCWWVFRLACVAISERRLVYRSEPRFHNQTARHAHLGCLTLVKLFTYCPTAAVWSLLDARASAVAVRPTPSKPQPLHNRLPSPTGFIALVFEVQARRSAIDCRRSLHHESISQ